MQATARSPLRSSQSLGFGVGTGAGSGLGLLANTGAALYAVRNNANAGATYGAPTLPTDLGVSARPGTGTALLFVESAATGDFARVQRAGGGGDGAGAGVSANATAASNNAGAGASERDAAAAAKKIKGPASAAEAFLLSKLRARSQGGWLGHIAEGVAGLSVAGEGVGADPPQDIKAGETLFAPFSSLIGRVARCAEGLLSGVLLFIAMAMVRLPAGSNSLLLQFMNVVGWQLEELRFLQFILAWVAWLGTASEWMRARTLLAFAMRNPNRESPASHANEGQTAITASLAAVARAKALAALSNRISALTVCVAAHTLTCILIVSSAPIDNRLRAAAVRAAVPSKIYLDIASFPPTAAADATSWSMFIYVRFVSSLIAYIASNAASPSPSDIFQAT